MAHEKTLVNIEKELERPHLIRQPIVTIAGHVDAGKTSILDSIRKSAVAAKEAGNITQKISFTLFPREYIKKRCPLLAKHKIGLEIPGFLFIDTPGHAAFSNLRKRGGALADLAILVIDINKGIERQTAEVIEILKLNKTPFIIALNKVDNISGWRKLSENISESINMQSTNTKNDFTEKMMTLEGAFHSYGFNALPFYDINDFTKNIALVPCSTRTGEGIPELLLTLCGLSQKFLKERLSIGKEAKGVVLEVKKEKTVQYIEAILYDGELAAKDTIAIASLEADKPLIGKIRVLEQVMPVSAKFEPVHRAHAATGVRMQLAENVEVLPGMPFQVFNNNKEEIVKEFRKQVSEQIRTDEEGIVVKADSLGSLEALLFLLRQEGFQIVKAGIGSIDKRDIIVANTNQENNPLNAVVLGFNVKREEDINELDLSKIKIVEEEVVYKLIEKLQQWKIEKENQLEKEKLIGLATVCKLKVLGQYVFHNSNPAIFGVRVEAGKIKPGISLIDEQLNEIGNVKNVQVDKETVKEAKAGMEVAISVGGANFERQIKGKEYLYSDMGENHFKEFKKNKDVLSKDEIDCLQKIAQIKRAGKPTWGV